MKLENLMDTPQTALCDLAAMEAGVCKGQRLDERARRKPCLGIGCQWQRPLVELRRLPHESGVSQEIL